MDAHSSSAGLVRVPGWERYAWLRHGFSTRHGGVSTVYGDGALNLGFTREDSPEAVFENRARMVAAVSPEGSWPMVSVRQVHADLVRVVDADPSGFTGPDGRARLEADGLITAVPRVLVAIQVADCVPVLVADTRLRVVGAFHAGWRGTAAAIVQKGIAQMTSAFGSEPADLVAAIGPSVGSCCYTVGDEVREAFNALFPYASELFSGSREQPHLDLAKANRLQLIAAGVPTNGVTVLGECTGCLVEQGRRKYFSHRMEQGVTGRAMGLIGRT